MIISGYDIFKETDEELIMSLDEMQNLLFSNQNYSSLFDEIEESAKRNSQKIALISKGESLSYSTLISRINQVSQVLSKSNIKYGQKVLLVAESKFDFCITLLALNKIGAVAIVTSSKLTVNEMNQMIKGVEITHVLISENYSRKYSFFERVFIIENIISESNNIDYKNQSSYKIQFDDPAIQLFTSGTTSKKKLVELTQKNILHACYSYRYVNHIVPEDSTVICNPIYHVTGLIALFYTFLISGGTIHLHERFSVKQLELDLKKNAITYLHLSPTAYKIFLNEKKVTSFPCVRLVASGSSFLPSKIISSLKRTFINADIVSIYGLTETSSPATILHHVEQIENYHSVGYPFPGIFLKIVNNHGMLLGINEVGKIMIKGTNIIRKYRNLVDNDSFLNEWLNTGDIGYIDDKYRLFLVDREKDMINRGGEKIFTTEIEEIFYQITGIKNCVALGISDDIYSEIPIVVLTIDKELKLDKEKINLYLKEKLSKYKIPQKFYLMDKIPEIESGKFDRKKIKYLITEGRLVEW